MVKSPGTSPERKKAKIDVYPMIVKDPQAREINETHLLNYTTALSSFETPTEEQLLVIEGDTFRHHPNEDVEQYFRASAQWGVPAIAWNIVRPAFLWKLEFCITEFMNVEKKKKEAAAEKAASQANNEVEKAVEPPVKEKMSILGHKINLIKTTPVVFNTEESMEFVLDKAKSFDGFPFTWQRLCELLTEPMKHYNTIDKFLRAVDKVINVVTTINEHGGRSFGDWEVPHSHQQNVENLFFGAVDEVEMMELEKLKNEFQSSSSSSSSSEEPLDMSQKSMPAPRSTSSPNSSPSFAPPTARSPISNNSPSSSPKATSPASSPKAISPVSSPKSASNSTTGTQIASPSKKEEAKDEMETTKEKTSEGHEEEMPQEEIGTESEKSEKEERTDEEMEIASEA
ncbi:hypothetical protein GCK72_001808 [Caenorhabditis remanei]|uniref:Uncharacterized protein n=1 Tax=Caenorhabditis remanei TaxID=31234 RepID=A0A6A5HRS8_CAERE|nr:hypothetical protein GCK72_001808 [Caenorhabditis remanei]KAF1769991.1 hypothetical protein GCK72_001808 [Caenorhabditis remanei]